MFFRKTLFLFFFLFPFIYLIILLLQYDQAFTQDLGRHIKLGEIITSCRCVPATNLFSYIHAEFPFINHHWFSEVIFYILYRYASESAILFLKILLVILTSVLMIFMAEKKASIFISAALFPFYAYIFSERFDSRPEIFSFILFGIFLLLLGRALHKGFEKRLLALIPLQVLWVNLHIYFIVGPLLFVFFLIDYIYHTRKAPSCSYLLLGGGILSATLINPHGFYGALEPFTILSDYGYSIVENQTIFFLNTVFYNPRIIIFEITFLIVVLGFILSVRKWRLYEILLVTFLSLAAMLQIRNFSLFAIGTFPFFSYAVKVILSYISAIGGVHMKKIIIYGFFAVLIFFVSNNVRQLLFSDTFGFGYKKSPKEALDFFIRHNLSGPIFNNFDIGSYIIFRLYPSERVYVDGRVEAYPSSFFEHYRNIQLYPRLFAEEVKKHKIQSIIFAHSDITPWGRIFIREILKNPSWKTVYFDETMIILLRDTKENKKLMLNEKLKTVLL